MYLHEDVMKQQKVVVGYGSEGWHTMLEGEIILKPCNFYRKVHDDVAKFVFSLSHSVENQQDKPLSHPVIQGAGTKANSRLHHVWVSHARPTFHYPEVGLACETKLWQSDHIFYIQMKGFNYWNLCSGIS